MTVERASGPAAAGPTAGLIVPFLTLACSLSIADEKAETPSATWRYEIRESNQSFALAPFHPLPLAAEKPEELLEEPEYRGHTRRYALLRYGSPNSPRVAIVLDERADGDFDLYVNADRDRFLTSDDLVPGKGDERTAALDAEITYADRPPDKFLRRVLMRRPKSGAALAVATQGYLEGSISINGSPLNVRRVDGDANGLFADLRDRIWVDRNADGRWDPFTEQFPFTPILRLEERRYAVRSDAGGERLALEPVVGAGTILLETASIDSAARVLELDAALYGDDGSAYAVRGQGEATAVPVGRYTLALVRLVVEAPETKVPWRFVFSRSGKAGAGEWHDVTPGARVTIDPIGKLRFELELLQDQTGIVPGETLYVTPRLYTEAGLLINSSSCGTQEDSSAGNGRFATVHLRTADAKVLSSYQSGFS